jgi:hypothetical protein
MLPDVVLIGQQLPVVRSRRDLEQRGVRFLPEGSLEPTDIPVTSAGTTYNVAAEVEWLGDQEHFAVGRWDGSLSVFEWTQAPTAGPLITTAASDPTSEGVQMAQLLGPSRMVTSCGDDSLALWAATGDDWSSMEPTTYTYWREGVELGAANSAALVEIGAATFLTVGHANGYLSLWKVAPGGTDMALQTWFDLRNPNPVNPWGLHNIRGVQAFAPPLVVTGSEDGFLCVVDVGSGKVVSQTVFNPNAKRGINSIAATAGGDLLVANCAVGSADYNLWYFQIGSSKVPQLRDKTNLRVDPAAPQVFNFCTIWAEYDQGPCFLSSTEEGALWMGTVSGGKLDVIGYRQVTSPLGSALGWAEGGRLALVANDLYEFLTLS